MQTIKLDTKDQRCPEVMIMVRRFLRESLTANTLCEITTTEPSALRDIPFYCSHESYSIVNTTSSNGSHTITVAIDEQKTTVIKNNVISIFNVDTYQAERDSHLKGAFNTLVSDLKSLMMADFQLVVPCSFGKDSNLVLTGALTAHEALMNDPLSQISQSTPFVVIHIDTGIEVVPMDMYSHHAMQALRAYCNRKNINLQLHHQKPPLHQQFASLFIGARKLPSTPSMNSDCAVIWKVEPSEAIQKKLIKEFGVDKLVSCLGSRVSEGTTRAASLKKYGNRDRTSASMLKANQKGIQTYTPIIDWTNEEVFELLQRCGENPLVRPTGGITFPCFMSSYRLLIQIYGDSSNDTCEINLGDHKAQQTGCNGSARNGCHQCFKAGKSDSSAMAHNSNVRWGNIQANATLVRDWVYRIAHDIDYRTHHPRTFDPVTNYAILQPNILSSRTLEKMLTYYVQLTHDDEVRAKRFTKQVSMGEEMQDFGYASIAQDLTMDESTRLEFMDMYRVQAQRHLLQIATLEHCLLLSAQWAMDGVKSLPYRPLAIWHNVVKLKKRIPYPTKNERPVVSSTISDAMTIRMCEPGVDLLQQWVAPHRPWDLLDADMTQGCFTEKLPNTIRVNVEYTLVNNTHQVSVKHAGKNIQVSQKTRGALIEQAQNIDATQGSFKFVSFLTNRTTSCLGDKISDAAKKPTKIQNFTRRTRKYSKKINAYIPGRTSLLMYKPQTTPSLERSVITEDKVWVPDTLKKTVPMIAQHQTHIADGAVNFKVDKDVVTYWLETDGLERAIALHDMHLAKSIKARVKDKARFTVRQFHHTHAFWELLQSGVISVNASTWATSQRTLQRTELFAQTGLFSLSDNANEIINHPATLNMTDHRHLKASTLINIRRIRNAKRVAVKQKLKAIHCGDAQTICSQLLGRIDALAKLRDQIAGKDYIDNALTVALGINGFDHKDYQTDALLTQEWMLNYDKTLSSVDAFLDKFGTQHEKALIEHNLAIKIDINSHMQTLNETFCHRAKEQLATWNRFSQSMTCFRDKILTGEIVTSTLLKAIRKESEVHGGNISTFFYSGACISEHLTGTTQSLTSRMLRKESDPYSVLAPSFHEPKWQNFEATFQSLTERHQITVNTLRQFNPMGSTTGIARAAALLSLQSAA